MATITDAQLLNEVKTRLAITGSFHDSLLTGYVKDIKDYLKRAGVSSETLSDDCCIGVVARGVSDLWNFGSGDGKFSSLFYDMATQLALSESSHEDETDYSSLKQLSTYLYEVVFEKLPPFKALNNAYIGGCSSFVRGGKLYRNLDWNYDKTIEFKVITKNFVGMSLINGLEDGMLDTGKIGQTPYYVNDGVNNDGIMVSSHVLYNDWNYRGAGDKSRGLMQLPYYVLSTVHSMSDISMALADYVGNIKVEESLVTAGYLMQFIVTDGTTTYAILPPTSATGSYVLVNITENPKITNFRWVPDRTVVRTDLQTHPTGVERFNEIDDSVSLEELRFTKAYEQPTRLSEFIGINGTTKESTDEELRIIYNTAHTKYLGRARNGELWQTCHSVIYSANGFESLCVQENWNKDYIV